MALTKAQKKKVKEALGDSLHCLGCGEKSEYEADLSSLPLRGTKKSITVLLVACQSCGHIELLSAKAHGIV